MAPDRTVCLAPSARARSTPTRCRQVPVRARCPTEPSAGRRQQAAARCGSTITNGQESPSCCEARQAMTSTRWHSACWGSCHVESPVEAHSSRRATVSVWHLRSPRCNTRQVPDIVWIVLRLAVLIADPDVRPAHRAALVVEGRRALHLPGAAARRSASSRSAGGGRCGAKSRARTSWCVPAAWCHARSPALERLRPRRRDAASVGSTCCARGRATSSWPCGCRATATPCRCSTCCLLAVRARPAPGARSASQRNVLEEPLHRPGDLIEVDQKGVVPVRRVDLDVRAAPAEGSHLLVDLALLIRRVEHVARDADRQGRRRRTGSSPARRCRALGRRRAGPSPCR